MIDSKQIFEWLKLSGKQAFIVCLISSIFLFGSESLISKLGLLDIKASIQPWLGVIWLLSFSVFISEAVYPIYTWSRDKVKLQLNLKKYQQQLHKLTPDEKEFLSHYITNKTRTNSAKYSNGVVKGLEAANIVYRASNMASYYDVFPFNIQPWAFDYLMENPDCLK